MGSGFFAGKFIAACMDAGTSSFADLVAECAPELLPGAGGLGGRPAAAVPPGPRARPAAAGEGAAPQLRHGTTIVAARFDGRRDHGR